MNNFAPYVKKQDSEGKGMYYRTGEDVNDGLEISSKHAESTRYLGLIEILRSNFGYKSQQRSDHFLMSKSSVIRKFILDSRFRSPLHQQMTPMFGVVILIGPNRYVDKLQHREPEFSPGKACHECMR